LRDRGAGTNFGSQHRGFAMRRAALAVVVCLSAFAATVSADEAQPDPGIRRAVALTRSSDDFKARVQEARAALQVVGSPVVVPNEDGSFTVSVATCPPCAGAPAFACLEACSSIAALVDVATGTVTVL
jgi:hypothetical protein